MLHESNPCACAPLQLDNCDQLELTRDGVDSVLLRLPALAKLQ